VVGIAVSVDARLFVLLSLSPTVTCPAAEVSERALNLTSIETIGSLLNAEAPKFKSSSSKVPVLFRIYEVSLLSEVAA